MCTDGQSEDTPTDEEAKRMEVDKIRARFMDHLHELSFDERDLAHFLHNQGGYPIEANLMASIRRMMDGEVGVTAELFVIVRMLVRQQRRLLARHSNVCWKEDDRGVWTATVDDCSVKIQRNKTNWQITCIDPDGDDVDWRLEVKSLEIAEKRALLWVEEGQNDRAWNQAEDLSF